MNLRIPFRALATASLLALTILTAPGLRGEALAAKDLCTPQTCGTQKCTADGKTWDYVGGQTIVVRGSDGKTLVYMCDGFTGRWISTADIQPEKPPVGPRAPLPTTKGT